MSGFGINVSMDLDQLGQMQIIRAEFSKHLQQVLAEAGQRVAMAEARNRAAEMRQRSIDAKAEHQLRAAQMRKKVRK